MIYRGETVKNDHPKLQVNINLTDAAPLPFGTPVVILPAADFEKVRDALRAEAMRAKDLIQDLCASGLADSNIIPAVGPLVDAIDAALAAMEESK